MLNPDKYADAVKAIPPPEGVGALPWATILALVVKLAPVLIDLLRDPRVQEALRDLRDLSTYSQSRVGGVVTPPAEEHPCEPPC